MKKLALLAIIITMIFLTACGSSDEEPEQTEPTTPPTQSAPATATSQPQPEPLIEEPVSPLAQPVSPLAQPVSPVPPATELDAPPPPAEQIDQQADLMVRAVERLNEMTGDKLEPGDVTNLQVESREWNDTSLGCPQEGMMYAQVITSGYLVTLEAKDNVYEVHADTQGNMILCTINGKNAADVLSNK